MPDRDVFTALPHPLRRAARSILGAARGQELELLDVAEGLNHLFAGGVASLPRILKCFDAQMVDDRQSCFPELADDLAYTARCALADIKRKYGRDGKDELLHQAAIRALNTGIRDTHHLLHQFGWSVLTTHVIEARGGVADQLAKRGDKLDTHALEKQLSPLVSTAAGLMLRNPSFKRLGLASKFRHEVDLYGESLL